ncbi:MAG: response regulator, partial [Deltaproteobacteria bacterium]|nr:response regulator [Deltaproteobacteria bacterium]
MKKVLIVDDISTNLYMLETVLKGYGFEVISAENGKEALDRARCNPPDLIVTDILMPVMDGYALCRQWKSDDTLKQIPLVFYTATYTEAKDEEFALSLGADRFILKPQEPDILMNMLQEVLQEEYTAKQVTAKLLGEEMELFRQHNEVLFNKLEKKMMDLETANQELRASEEKLRRMNAFLDSIVENIPDMIFLKDVRELRFVRFNRAGEELLGYSRDDLLGKNDYEFFPKEQADFFTENDRKVLHGKEVVDIPEESIQTSNRGERILHTKKVPILDAKGDPEYLLGISEDITDRKRAEEALKESETKYR